MQSHFFVELAILHKFQTFGCIFFVLFSLVIQIMADSALKIYEMVLGHKRYKIKDLRLKIIAAMII